LIQNDVNANDVNANMAELIPWSCVNYIRIEEHSPFARSS